MTWRHWTVLKAVSIGSQFPHWRRHSGAINTKIDMTVGLYLKFMWETFETIPTIFCDPTGLQLQWSFFTSWGTYINACELKFCSRLSQISWGTENWVHLNKVQSKNNEITSKSVGVPRRWTWACLWVPHNSNYRRPPSLHASRAIKFGMPIQ